MDKTKVLAIIAILFFIMSLGIRIGKSLPEHALVLSDYDIRRYTTVPCLLRGAVEARYVLNVRAVIEENAPPAYDTAVVSETIEQARMSGLKPDRSCRDNDGFTQLERWPVAVLGLGRERVAVDGTVL